MTFSEALACPPSLAPHPDCSVFTSSGNVRITSRQANSTVSSPPILPYLLSVGPDNLSGSRDNQDQNNSASSSFCQRERGRTDRNRCILQGLMAFSLRRLELADSHKLSWALQPTGSIQLQLLTKLCGLVQESLTFLGLCYLCDEGLVLMHEFVKLNKSHNL